MNNTVAGKRAGDRSGTLIRAMVQGGAGFCVLTVGGLSVLALPGEPNLWLVGVVLAGSAALLASAARDLQAVLND